MSSLFETINDTSDTTKLATIVVSVILSNKGDNPNKRAQQ